MTTPETEKEGIPHSDDTAQSEIDENGLTNNTVRAQLTAVKEESSGEAPDGGFVAWTQVIGAHFLFFNSW
jgi:hypothetical protein